MSEIPVISRLAPTPSGFLHEGNVFNFILTWLYVRSKGGKLHLRIDDLDRARVKRSYVDFIFRTLDWLEMDYDYGPTGTEDFLKNYSQRLHLDEYYAFINRLEQNEFLFNCDCSRKEIKALNSFGHYSGQCLTQGIAGKTKHFAQRVNTDRAVEYIGSKDAKLLQDHMPYFIVRRKEGLPAYQVASVVDDLRMDINYVVRGEDLKYSTLAQSFIAEVVGNNTFQEVYFVEHPLIRKNGDKLSKSQKSSAICLDQETKVYMLEKVAKFLNMRSEKVSLEELLNYIKRV